MQLTGTNHPSGLILFEVACFQVTAFGSVDELRLKKDGFSVWMSGSGRRPADNNRTQQQAFAGTKVSQTTRVPALNRGIDDQGRPLVARARWNHPVPFRTRK